MYRLGQCTLIYLHHSVDENYNPIIERVEKLVKCKLMESFSFNYYQNQTRDMRKSKNIIVAKTDAFDQIVNDNRYQLEYVLIGGTKYKLINLLKDRNSSLNSILDCQEVINE